MKPWIKLETNILQDARFVHLVDELGVKGLGAYICMVIQLEKCSGVLTIKALCQLISNNVRSRLAMDVLTKYDLFDVEDSFVRVRTPIDAPADAPTDAPTSGCAPVPIVSNETIYNRDIDKEEEAKLFIAQMQTNYPRVMKLDEPLKKVEFDKVVARYGLVRVIRTIREMENHRDLLKSYHSAYRTLLNWLDPDPEKYSRKKKTVNK